MKLSSYISYIFLYFLCRYRVFSEEMGNPILEVSFQNPEKVTTESFLDSGPSDIPNMSKFSICFRFKFLQYVGFPSFLSYFSGEDDEIKIRYDGDTYAIVFECCTQSVIFEGANRVIHLDTWQSFCVAVDFESKKLKVLFNNEILIRKIGDVEPLIPLRGYGRMVLGQDLDSAEGHYSITQSFYGSMSDFRIYERMLSNKELKEYDKCTLPYNPKETLYDFEDKFSKFKVNGPVYLSNTSSELICKKANDSEEVLFPLMIEFDKAVKLCSSLKGVMTAPTNLQELEDIYNKISSFQNICLSTKRTISWLGIISNEERTKWVNIQNKQEISDELNDNFFLGVDSPQKHRCVGLGGRPFGKILFGQDCLIPACTLCTIPRNTYVTLRGLPDTIKGFPESNFIDNTFVVTTNDDRRPSFTGMFSTNIIWKKDFLQMSSRNHFVNGTAVLKDVGVHYNSTSYPFGKKDWNVVSSSIDFSGPLLLSPCLENEIACLDYGFCLPKEKRCNGIYDCEDKSDELECQILHYDPKEYAKDHIPMQKDMNITYINISFRIVFVRSLNLYETTLTIDANININWFDNRVKFKNLHTDYNENKIDLIDQDKLWLPHLIIQDGNHSPVDDESKMDSLFVKKETLPLRSDFSRIFTDDFYHGENNSLYLVQLKLLKSTCKVDLKRYPFDTQICELYITLNGAPKYVKLIKDVEGPIYENQRKLFEYELIYETCEETVFRGNSALKVNLMFRNQYLYYVGNSVLPSFLILIICYSTFFFDIKDFQNRVMVSLTSLLVLMSLFSQTAETIPRTSYIKLVDAWFITVIVLSFSIIITIIVIEYIKRGSDIKDKNRMKINPFEFRENSVKVGEIKNRIVKLNFYAKGVFQLSFILMLIVFGTIAFKPL